MGEADEKRHGIPIPVRLFRSKKTPEGNTRGFEVNALEGASLGAWAFTEAKRPLHQGMRYDLTKRPD